MSDQMDTTKGACRLGSNLSEILEKRQQRSEIPEAEFGDVNKVLAEQQRELDPERDMSRKEIREYQTLFKRFDRDKDGFMDLEDMKLMMESIGAPQTHLSLKQMIKEVDRDRDGRISFKEFLLIYHKSRECELEKDSGLQALVNLTCVDVTDCGVGGAKNFFEKKIEQLTAKSKFEEEIKQEQEERKKIEEQKANSKKEFRSKFAVFEQVTN